MKLNVKNSRGFVNFLILITIFIILFAFVIYFLFINKEKNINLPLNLPNLVASPTPFPFQELTIPYLKQKEYKSTLGNLEKIQEYASYTAYITSYLSDTFKVYGLLTIPKSESENTQVNKKWPAVIFIHGYIPPENYRTLTNYVSWTNYLAKNGFVVFKIDLRGHGNSEGEPGGAYYSSDYIIDTLNAFSALQSADFVDPQKIGIWGHSMAGNIVLRSLAVKPDIPAAVIWAGAGYTYTDLQEYMIDDNSYRPPPADSERARKRQQLRNAYGNFDPDNWFWKQIPATNYLSDIKGVIQINHAANDNVVSIDYSRNLDNILNKAQIRHELKEYPTGGHNLTGETFTQALQNTSDFFKLNLK